jgi:sugar/nucleoside kinase (ribokinase family)
VEGTHETSGGGGANRAAIAARLGARSAFIGQRGDDDIGGRLDAAMVLVLP